MNLDLIKNIQTKYANLYTMAKKLHDFDKSVSDSFIKKYGNNTFDNIMITHEYNKELGNVSMGIITNTELSKLAQKRHRFFKNYSKVSYTITQELGYAKTMEYMDLLDKYFSTMSSIV